MHPEPKISDVVRVALIRRRVERNASQARGRANQ
jgi:hypothetical protein